MKTSIHANRICQMFVTCVLACVVFAVPALIAQGDEPSVLTERTGTAHMASEFSVPQQHVPASRPVTALFISDSKVPKPREGLDETALVRLAVGANSLTDDDKQLRISARYQDPKMLKYLSTANSQQITQLYYEASNLIDTRHVKPLSYEERTQAALADLIRAVENPAFLSANSVNANSQSIRELQAELDNLARTQTARSLSESLGIMQWAQELANRRVGLRREAVALEFFNGTIDSLDKYSAFMPGDSPFATGSVEPLTQTAGLEENIVGIGVELKAHERGALVLDVIEGGPAAKMQLQGGDIIVAVNLKPVAGQSLNQIANQIGGQSGSTVTLDVERNGRKYRGTARRQKVYVSSVSGAKMVDASTGTGYIRLKQFSESSAEDLEKALWSLHKQGMKSLVLDLRGNPGGLLDEAIVVCDLFLPCGTIVSTKGPTSQDNTSESAKFDKTWSTPLVVLVDGDSASASEIFAAAIQENRRGVVVGRTSYGKGTVQTHFPLKSTNGLLKLTTAKFYSPAGREMAGAGVTPDFPVNVQTVGYRGTVEDADVSAALQLVAQGIPAQLASKANQCLAPQAGSSFNTNGMYGGAPAGNFLNPGNHNPGNYSSGNYNLGNSLQPGNGSVRNFSQELFGVAPPVNPNWIER